jgi:hypothetical protein
VSTVVTQLTQSPLSEALSECELAQIHGSPTNDRPGRINGSETRGADDIFHCFSPVMAFLSTGKGKDAKGIKKTKAKRMTIAGTNERNRRGILKYKKTNLQK